MKRVVLSVVGTVMGLVALLSFKSHGQEAVGAQLPSASLPGQATSGAASTAPSDSASTDPAAGSSAAPSTSAAPVSAAPTSAPATSAPATSAPATSKAAPVTKTYDGTAEQTRYGVVQVRVTVVSGKITDVTFLQLTSEDGRSAQINNEAGPMLLQETLASQSGNINTISGATYTSDGYIQSLQSALDQAGIK